MKNYRFNLHLFFVISAQISLLLTGFSLYLIGEVNLKSLGNLILHNELILLPLTLLYYYFENTGWHKPAWKWTRHFLKFPPDIRGRWEGKLMRYSPDKYESEIVFEIEQSMTKLQVNTYTKNHNESISILDDIASDIQHENNYHLCFLWEGKATNLPSQNEGSGKFRGYTILKIKNNKGGKEMTGEYFTDRRPSQTQGTIKVTWISYELKGEY